MDYCLMVELKWTLFMDVYIYVYIYSAWTAR